MIEFDRERWSVNAVWCTNGKNRIALVGLRGKEYSRAAREPADRSKQWFFQMALHGMGAA